MEYVADLYKKISVNYEIRSDLPRIFVRFRRKPRRSLQAVNDGAVFYESAEKTGQSAVYIFLPDNPFILIKNVFAWVIVYKITKVFRQINVILFFPSGRKILKTVDFNTLM